MTASGLTVLYVEDEESDRLLMQMAFSKEAIRGALHTVDNGSLALDYLRGSGPFADRTTHPLPSVVLLDLNLPEMHGFEVLQWIRDQPAHRNLPVVIFTSSDRDEDRLRATELRATDYIHKPNSPSLFREIARKLSRFNPEG